MNYQGRVLELFCQNKDYEWVEKYATAEIINSEQDRDYPLIFCLVSRGFVDERIFKIFVDRGCDWNATNSKGDNVFHSASYGKAYQIIPLLARMELNIDQQGFNEHTALTITMNKLCAEDMARRKTFEAVLYAGAKVSGYRQRGHTVMQIAESVGPVAVGCIQCRMVMDAFVECAKKKKLCCPDVIHIIRDYIWSLRLDWLMNHPNKK